VLARLSLGGSRGKEKIKSIPKQKGIRRKKKSPKSHLTWRDNEISQVDRGDVNSIQYHRRGGEGNGSEMGQSLMQLG